MIEKRLSSLQRAWMHIAEQPFIAATGFAALVHSTWSLGMFFSGAQPPPPELGMEAGAWIVFFIKTCAWHAPALAIAFALDVGQISTSHEIRTAVQRGDMPLRKYITFAVFALATYFLQWLYCAHHLPLLELGKGVSELHRGTALALRDYAVWVVPAFLPLSTFMYTFSYSKAMQTEAIIDAPIEVHIPPAVQVSVKQDAPVETPALKVVNAPALKAVNASSVAMHAPARSNPTGNYTGEAKDAVHLVDGAYIFTCPYCNKATSYDNEASAVKGASAHVGRYCKVKYADEHAAVNQALPENEYAGIASQNGTGGHE